MYKRWPVVVACLMLGGVSGTLITGQVLKGQQPQTTAVPKEFNSYRGIVKTVLPAVVSISHRSMPVAVKGQDNPPNRRMPRFGFGDMLDPDQMRRFLEEMDQNPNPVPQQGFGSGFIVDPNGVILTNYPSSRAPSRWRSS
jgi:S1-C subfamily serine protease